MGVYLRHGMALEREHPLPVRWKSGTWHFVKRSSVRQKRIALIGLPVLESESLFNAGLMRHAFQDRHWRFVFSAEASASAFRFLRELDCDGAIVRMVSAKMREEALRVDFPLVNVSSWLEHPCVPTVRLDNEESGRLCARHLLERRFRRFGILQLSGDWMVTERIRGFVETVQASDSYGDVSIFELHSQGILLAEAAMPAQAVKRAEMNRFRAWISTLRPPVGLFLTDDVNAPQFMDACRAQGLRIPQDVAVISGYHHPYDIRNCVPPLTHIDMDEEGWALQAAQYLDHLMNGGSPRKDLLMPPRGVVALRSTDTLAVDDPMAARAVEFIREHSGENINIKVVADRLSLQRRTLERRFASAMGISLHQFMVSERVMRAENLLGASPRLSLAKIASQCGFFDSRHMKRIMKQAARAGTEDPFQTRMTG